MKMSPVGWIAFILVIIGGLNWGLVGLGLWMSADWNVVNIVLGTWPMVEALVYVLVGLSAIYMLVKGMTMKSSQ